MELEDREEGRKKGRRDGELELESVERETFPPLILLPPPRGRRVLSKDGKEVKGLTEMDQPDRGLSLKKRSAAGEGASGEMEWSRSFQARGGDEELKSERWWIWRTRVERPERSEERERERERERSPRGRGAEGCTLFELTTSTLLLPSNDPSTRFDTARSYTQPQSTHENGRRGPTRSRCLQQREEKGRKGL